jgi:hypothetical protein
MEKSPFDIFKADREFIAPFFAALFHEEVRYKSIKLLNDNESQVMQIFLEAKNSQDEFEQFSVIFHWLAFDVTRYALQRYVLDVTKMLPVYDLMHENRERHIQVFCTLNQNDTGKTDFIHLHYQMTGMQTDEVIESNGSILEEKISSYFLIDLHTKENFSVKRLLEDIKAEISL